MLVERPVRAAPQESRPEAGTAGPRLPFIAYVTDEESEAALRAGLLASSAKLEIRRGDARSAARALERETTPSLLLVDVSGIADPVAALDALSRVCTPDVRVLVIGESSDISLYRRLTREIGVAEYLYKPLTRDAVSRLFAPLLAGSAEAGAEERGGRAIAICGARGGCGATTIAVNLALQLAEQTHAHVALLDLHLRGGTAGLMFGARGGGGLRVALEDPERVDALFLDRSSVPVAERVTLVATEEPMESTPNPKPEGVTRLLSMLTARFNFVVVDIPMPPGPAEAIALAAARHRVVVLGPDVAGIRDALALRKAMAGIGSGHAMTLLNRAGLPGGLKDKLVEDGLGARPDVVIPDLPRELPRAAHLGRPALKESRALRKALAPLTQEIAAVRAAPAPATLLARLFGRGGA
jgi:pilus assembly protein CpaE